MYNEITYSKPLLSDSKQIFQLLKKCPPLDVNSEYLYLMMCYHFADTCVVAKDDGRVVGFITAFMPPSQNNSLFVWQAAVSEDYRGKRIAQKMLESIIQREECDHIRFIEATVTPENKSSQSFLADFAKSLGASHCIVPLFTKNHFVDSHEEENLLRIGPIKVSKLMEVKA